MGHSAPKFLNSFTLIANDMNNNKPPATSKSFPPEFVPAGHESTCGEIDESQPVEMYDGNLGVTKDFVVAHQPSVAQIQWNNDLATKYQKPGNVVNVRWCSGTMISEDLYLSAGHCFDSVNEEFGWQVPKVSGTNDPIQPKEIAKNMHINFNYQVDSHGALRHDQQSFAIVELLEHRLGDLDYAIVKVDGKPGKIFGITPIAVADALISDMLCIIGHPLGKPKVVEAGPCSDFSDTKIGYNTLDTQGGNSGSGILGKDGTIVGVHTQGGCNSIGFNSGEKISSLIQASPIIKRIANGQSP
jgi:V8-like Glu-specific endopeptidase